ncbi:MAG: YebC/PmpR family DNA-binding transcriptional regulator, partial [Halanaerobiales bacterium]
YEIDSADLVMIPESQVKLEATGTAKKLLRLMDELEDHDDIQDVYSNFDIPDQVMEEIEDEV